MSFSRKGNTGSVFYRDKGEFCCRCRRYRRRRRRRCCCCSTVNNFTIERRGGRTFFLPQTTTGVMTTARRSPMKGSHRKSRLAWCATMPVVRGKHQCVNPPPSFPPCTYSTGHLQLPRPKSIHSHNIHRADRRTTWAQYAVFILVGCACLSSVEGIVRSNFVPLELANTKIFFQVELCRRRESRVKVRRVVI